MKAIYLNFLVGFLMLIIYDVQYSSTQSLFSADLLVKRRSSLSSSIKRDMMMPMMNEVKNSTAAIGVAPTSDGDDLANNSSISIDVALNLDNGQTILNLIADDSGLNKSSSSNGTMRADCWPANFYYSPFINATFNQTAIESNRNGDVFNFKFVPFSFFSGIHSAIQIYENGYVELESDENDQEALFREPPRSFQQYKFNYIAPFWSSALATSSKSEIVVSLNRLNESRLLPNNDASSNSSSLFESVDADIRRFRNLKTTNIHQPPFRSQAIILITWKNFRLAVDSDNPNQTNQTDQMSVSFQVAIATNYLEQESYLITNYNLTIINESSLHQPSSNEHEYYNNYLDLFEYHDYFEVNESESESASLASMNKIKQNRKDLLISKIIRPNQLTSFIGYKNLIKSYQYMNEFSNSIDKSQIYRNSDDDYHVAADADESSIAVAVVGPLQVFDRVGNTNKRGHYVFDITHKANDSCLTWYNSMQLNRYGKHLDDVIRNRTFLQCPCTNMQAHFNEFLKVHSSSSTSQNSNTICYEMDFNVNIKTVFILINQKLIMAKQFCCYDLSTGSLINSNSNAGFLYLDSQDENGNLTSIISLRNKCCSESGVGKGNCDRFYEIYKPNTCNHGLIIPAQMSSGEEGGEQKDRLSSQLNQTIINEISSYRPPIVKFRNEPLYIYWNGIRRSNNKDSLLNRNVEIVVDIIDNSTLFMRRQINAAAANKHRSIELLVAYKSLSKRGHSTASATATATAASSNNRNAFIQNRFKSLTTSGDTTTMKFVYFPIYDEIPIFSVSVTDDQLNLTTIETMKKLKICNCNRIDRYAKCDLNQIQEIYDANVEFQFCKCSSGYTGKFCDKLKDHCLSRPCRKLYSSVNLNCYNLSPDQQINLNKSFICCPHEIHPNGTCKLEPIRLFTGILTNDANTNTSLQTDQNEEFTIIFEIILPIISFVFVLAFLFMFIFFQAEKQKLNLLRKNRNKLMPIDGNLRSIESSIFENNNNNNNNNSSMTTFGNEKMNLFQKLSATNHQLLMNFLDMDNYLKLHSKQQKQQQMQKQTQLEPQQQQKQQQVTSSIDMDNRSPPAPPSCADNESDLVSSLDTNTSSSATPAPQSAPVPATTAKLVSMIIPGFNNQMKHKQLVESSTETSYIDEVKLKLNNSEIETEKSFLKSLEERASSSHRIVNNTRICPKLVKAAVKSTCGLANVSSSMMAMPNFPQITNHVYRMNESSLLNNHRQQQQATNGNCGGCSGGGGSRIKKLDHQESHNVVVELIEEEDDIILDPDGGDDESTSYSGSHHLHLHHHLNHNQNQNQNKSNKIKNKNNNKFKFKKIATISEQISSLSNRNNNQQQQQQHSRIKV